MTTTYPPDGWRMYSAGSVAVWGTDVFDNTTLTNLVGANCIEFTNTAPGADPYLLQNDYTPVEEGRPYLVRAIVQANSIASGKNIKCYINYYTSAKVYISNTAIYNTVLSAANTWLEISMVVTPPSTARYFRLQFGKEDDNGYKVYLDWIGVTESPRTFFARLGDSGQVVSASSGEYVEFGSEVYDHGSIYNNTTYKFTVPKTGIWSIMAQIYFTCVNADELFEIQLYKNGSVWVYGGKRYSTVSGEDVCLVAIAPAAYLTVGDYIQVLAVNGVASDRSIIGYTDYSLTYFSSTEIGL